MSGALVFRAEPSRVGRILPHALWGSSAGVRCVRRRDLRRGRRAQMPQQETPGIERSAQGRIERRRLARDACREQFAQQGRERQAARPEGRQAMQSIAPGQIRQLGPRKPFTHGHHLRFVDDGACQRQPILRYAARRTKLAHDGRLRWVVQQPAQAPQIGCAGLGEPTLGWRRGVPAGAGRPREGCGRLEGCPDTGRPPERRYDITVAADSRPQMRQWRRVDKGKAAVQGLQGQVGQAQQGRQVCSIGKHQHGRSAHRATRSGQMPLVLVLPEACRPPPALELQRASPLRSGRSRVGLRGSPLKFV